jgi:hypothetical protein
MRSFAILTLQGCVRPAQDDIEEGFSLGCHWVGVLRLTMTEGGKALAQEDYV